MKSTLTPSVTAIVVGVLHHQVLAEEPEGLLGRGGGQPDQVGVEVLQDLPPQPVDGAVALIDDDHVECVRWQGRVVADLDRLRDRQLVDGVLVDLLVQVRLALEDREDPLDGGDADPRGRVERVVGQVLDVVLGGELPLGLRDGELVELQLGLLAQVRAVDQEQDPLGVGVLDQPVAERSRR